MVESCYSSSLITKEKAGFRWWQMPEKHPYDKLACAAARQIIDNHDTPSLYHQTIPATVRVKLCFSRGDLREA